MLCCSGVACANLASGGYIAVRSVLDVISKWSMCQAVFVDGFGQLDSSLHVLGCHFTPKMVIENPLYIQKYYFNALMCP